MDNDIVTCPEVVAYDPWVVDCWPIWASWEGTVELINDEVRKLGVELGLPYEFLDHVSRRMVNGVNGISRVVYD